MINTNKKAGFTLAEVLITLGVIGVVATLTLPNVMASYAKRSQVAQLQRSVNAVTNAAQNYLLENNADSLDGVIFDADRFISEFLGAAHTGGLSSAMSEYYRSVSDPNSSAPAYILLGDYSRPSYACGKLDTGATVCVSYNTQSDGNRALAIDVNANAGPNVYGRDLFTMGLNPKGKVVAGAAVGGSGGSGYEYGFGGSGGGCLNDASNCFGQIVHDGWQMKY